MAFLRLDPKSHVWYIVDKTDKRNSYKRLGKDRTEIDKSDAKLALRRYQREKNYLRLNLPVASLEMSFTELVNAFDEYRKGRVADKTRTNQTELLEMLGRTFGNKRIDVIKAEDIKAHLLEKKYKPNTIHKYVHALRKAYQFAIQKNYLTSTDGTPVQNPMFEIPIPKIEKGIPKPINPSVMERVIKELNGNARDYFMILAHTGGRPEEILRLKVKDILPNGLALTKTKNYKQRNAPLTKKIKVILNSLKKGKNPEDYLFPARDGEGHQKSFKSALDRALRRINKNLKHKIKVSPRQFRHTFATMVLQKTNNLKYVSELLGHASISTTEIYAKVLPDELQKAVEMTFNVSRATNKKKQK